MRSTILHAPRHRGTHAETTRNTMRTYTCDGCKKPLEPPVYMHTLTVLYSPEGNNSRELHFHWECLKKYVKEA